MKETETLKFRVEVLKQCGNCRNVISLLILFCPCQKSDDAPRNFREAPRDDKIKLFHELWWEHFWSWRYHSHSRDWNRFVEEQPQEYKKEISSRWSEIKWDQGFSPFSPCLIIRNTRNVEYRRKNNSCFHSTFFSYQEVWNWFSS